MFTIDKRLKGLPALKEQVVALYESLNQPHLAIPGRSAGPAKAYILGLRGPSGFAVFVYLALFESGECAVYMPSNRSATPEQYAAEEADALGFVESMGFIMDNINFRARSVSEQDKIVRTWPPFQRAPGPAVPRGTPVGAMNPLKPDNATTNATLGKLLGSFCLLLLAVSGCKHVPTEKESAQAA